MPLFRFIHPPAGLEDATYQYDENPDPKRFESADKPRPKSTAKSEEM